MAKENSQCYLYKSRTGRKRVLLIHRSLCVIFWWKIACKRSRSLIITIHKLGRFRNKNIDEFENVTVCRYYLYNEGRNVILACGAQRFQFIGPKNLLRFHRINRIEEHVIYVDCYFLNSDGKIYSEEDYIDLTDVLMGYESILEGKYEVIIGKASDSEKEILMRN